METKIYTNRTQYAREVGAHIVIANWVAGRQNYRKPPNPGRTPVEWLLIDLTRSAQWRNTHPEQTPKRGAADIIAYRNGCYQRRAQRIAAALKLWDLDIAEALASQLNQNACPHKRSRRYLTEEDRYEVMYMGETNGHAVCLDCGYDGQLIGYSDYDGVPHLML